MSRMVKVFCSGKDQKDLSTRHRVVEQYDGFILAEVSEQEKGKISQEYPVEDITDLYSLRVGEQVIDTSIPRIEATGKVSSHPAYRGVKPLSAGRHHYLVQFIGPIKNEWLNKIKQAGGEPRVPYANFTYITRADDKILKQIAAFPFVRWVIRFIGGQIPNVSNRPKRSVSVPQPRRQ